MRQILLKILLNTLLGILLIFIWSRFVDIKQILENLQNIKYELGLIFVIFFILAGMLRALRLKLLLGSKKLVWKDLTLLNYLCQFLSFTIPIRAGEVAKSLYLSMQYDFSFGKTVVWVFVDRFLDFWVYLLLAALFLFMVPTKLPYYFVWLMASIFLFATIIIFISFKNADFLKKVMVFLSKFLILNSLKKYFISFTHTIIDGLEILNRKPKELGILILTSILAVLADIIVWATAFWALNANLPIAKIILGTSLEAFTFMIPAAPGYVGSAEASGLAVFSGILGLESNLASATIVIFHIMTMLTILVLGLISIYLLKFDVGLVWKRLKGK